MAGARLSLTYAGVLREAGDLAGAVTHSRAAAEAGVPSAWPATVHYLDEAGRAAEALDWLRRHAEAGTAEAAEQLAWQAVRNDDRPLAGEALAMLHAQADAGDRTALGAIPRLLAALNRPEEALAAEFRATEAGGADRLGRLLPHDLPQPFATVLTRMHRFGLEPGGTVSPEAGS
jgi:hypothetical protein